MQMVMLLNAKTTLNESIDYIISTYELEQQLLLVCLSAISILELETESPIKKVIPLRDYWFQLG